MTAGGALEEGGLFEGEGVEGEAKGEDREEVVLRAEGDVKGGLPVGVELRLRSRRERMGEGGGGSEGLQRQKMFPLKSRCHPPPTDTIFLKMY